MVIIVVWWQIMFPLAWKKCSAETLKTMYNLLIKFTICHFEPSPHPIPCMFNLIPLSSRLQSDLGYLWKRLWFLASIGLSAQKHWDNSNQLNLVGSNELIASFSSNFLVCTSFMIDGELVCPDLYFVSRWGLFLLLYVEQKYSWAQTALTRSYFQDRDSRPKEQLRNDNCSSLDVWFADFLSHFAIICYSVEGTYWVGVGVGVNVGVK